MLWISYPWTSVIALSCGRLFEVAKFKYTASITSNTTSFQYVCRPPLPLRTPTFDDAKIHIYSKLTKK